MSIRGMALELFGRTLMAMASGLGETRRVQALARLSARVAPDARVETRWGSVLFHCPGPRAAWRAETLLTKEPETIQWIDQFQPGSVFWDVGANVGAFSIYTAKRGDVRVLAFEPSASSLSLLTRNIALNQLGSVVTPYCLALTDKTALGLLRLSALEAGAALNSFETSGFETERGVHQGMLAVSMDDLIYRWGMPEPNYIKIDVDGLEPSILDGAQETLRRESVQSVLVEIDSTDKAACSDITNTLKRSGFRPSSIGAPGRGRWKETHNHIFSRG